jgi:transposase
MKMTDIFRDRAAMNTLLDPADPKYVTGSEEDRKQARAEWHRQRFIAEVMRSSLPEIPRSNLQPLRFGTLEELVDVPASLTCDGRRSSGQRGKHDQGDALVIARVALRDRERLPRMDATVLDDELKLLTDARDQLIVEAGRWRNRTHALLRVAAPGYQTTTGALASAGSLRRARVVARRATRHDPTRGRLALQALDRLAALERDAGKLEREIKELLEARGCTHLLAIRGVGPIVAAKILGETRGIRRFRNASAFAAHTGTAPVPASSGRTRRHRLNRGGNRQLNRALYTIAVVQARWDPAARVYLERKTGEGKSAAEARRCLKRHLSNVVYRALLADHYALALT